jgi:hypothetical protein
MANNKRGLFAVAVSELVLWPYERTPYTNRWGTGTGRAVLVDTRIGQCDGNGIRSEVCADRECLILRKAVMDRCNSWIWAAWIREHRPHDDVRRAPEYPAQKDRQFQIASRGVRRLPWGLWRGAARPALMTKSCEPQRSKLCGGGAAMETMLQTPGRTGMAGKSQTSVIAPVAPRGHACGGIPDADKTRNLRRSDTVRMASLRGATPTISPGNATSSMRVMRLPSRRGMTRGHVRRAPRMRLPWMAHCRPNSIRAAATRSVSPLLQEFQRASYRITRHA